MYNYDNIYIIDIQRFDIISDGVIDIIIMLKCTAECCRMGNGPSGMCIRPARICACT